METIFDIFFYFAIMLGAVSIALCIYQRGPSALAAVCAAAGAIVMITLNMVIRMGSEGML